MNLPLKKAIAIRYIDREQPRGNRWAAALAFRPALPLLNASRTAPNYTDSRSLPCSTPESAGKKGDGEAARPYRSTL